MDRKQWEDPIRTTDNTASGYSAHRKQTQEKILIHKNTNNTTNTQTTNTQTTLIHKQPIYTSNRYTQATHVHKQRIHTYI